MPKKNTKKSKTETIKFRISVSKKLLFTLLACFILLITSLISLFFIFQTRFYPFVSIANTPLIGLTKTQAEAKINQALSNRANQTLNFKYLNTSTSSASLQTFQINLAQLFQATPSSSINQAFELGHSQFYFQPVNSPLNITFTPQLDFQITAIAQTINQPALNAQLKIEGDELTVTPSQNGLKLDEPTLKKYLADYLNTGFSPPEFLPTAIDYPKLSYSTALRIKTSLDALKLRPIKLSYEGQSWIIDQPTALGLLDLQNSQPNTNSSLTLDPQKMSDFLKNIASNIDQPVIEPLFSFDGQKVIEFKPPQNGQALNIAKTTKLITEALTKSDTKEINLPVEVTLPKNKLTNDLGIKELIGRGISNFAGSIPNRVYNVQLTASKINGILIHPGDTFSFDNTVGDITAANGFKQAYVIKDGRTVLDDGGGVCQDSTTLFRAVLNAGLPIVERTAHAYRVGYYEQGFSPGLDATIFYPSVDFKFKNDTPASILIQSYTYGTTLYVDLYGTSDGRIVKLTTPIVTNQTPPPPALHQDDPTLPKGVVKQVDFSAWGANVSFVRTVTRNGLTLINEAWKSNYRPWQAIYLVGTGG